jgi:two-component system, chemotaxis family, sensor kinase CheA
MVDLNRELQLQTESQDAAKATAINIVVLQADERQFGLVVDEINDTEEIVVKPLGKQLKRIKTFAGSTIMGDGRVALILDVMGLAQASNVISESRERTLSEGGKQTGTSAGEKQTVLVFQCGSEGRMAMPLSMVARLEEFKAQIVEKTGDLQVVQYRGKIMPLIRVSDVLHNGSGQAAELSSMQVVVYSEQGRSVGLVVDRILDIVEEAFVVQQPV